MESRIGHIYPSVKFFYVLLTIIFCMFTPGYSFQYAIFLVFLILSMISGTIRSFLSVFFKSIFLIVLFIFIIQVFIVKNEDSQQIWWIFSFSKVGLENSLLMTSKIIGISSVIIYFFQVTSIKDINYAMEKAGIPRKVTFVIAATIQLVPQMSNLSRPITDAQKSRGIETEGSMLVRMKSFVPMIGPLVLSSIQQTEERVLTLEARGFSSKKKKTAIDILQKTLFDRVLEIVCFMMLVIYIVWRIKR